MENFEKYKMLEYITAALTDKKFLRENLNNFLEWYDDNGYKYFKLKLLDENCSSFEIKDYIRNHKKEILEKCQTFCRTATKKLSASANRKPGIKEQRLRIISQLLNLSEDESRVLGVIARIKTDDTFDDLTHGIFGRCGRVKTALNYYLNIKQNKIENILSSQSNLKKFGLIENDFGSDISATDLLTKLVTENISSSDDVKKLLLGSPQQPTLDWNDFSHIKEKEYCAKILKKAVSCKVKGINLLFYGAPGTGKTEFAKTLCRQIGASLYSIGENFSDDDRNECLQLAETILGNDTDTCLLIDEADDFLCSPLFSFNRRKENEKLYINRLLENNITPTIWIINSIDDVNKAYLRRFAYSVNFCKPNLKTRTEMWQKNLKIHNLPSDRQTATEFAERYKISPSFISTAVKSAALVNGGLDEVKQALNSLQRAYNTDAFAKKAQKRPPCSIRLYSIRIQIYLC